MTLFISMFVIDIEKALIFLLIIRSSIDFFHTKPLFRYGDSDINLAGVLSIAVIGLGLAYLIKKRIRLFRIPLVCPFVIFFVLCLISLVFAPDKILGIQDIFRLFSIFIIFILVYDLIKTKRQILHITRFLLLALPIPLAMGFYQIWTKEDWMDPIGIYDEFGRIMGSFVHPNVFAGFLMIFLSIVVFQLLICRSRAMKIVWGGLILLMIFSLFHTYARGAWIGTLAMFLVLGILKYRKLLIIIPLIVLVTFLFIPDVSERFLEIPKMVKNFDVKSKIFRPTVERASFQWRLWMWYRSFEKALAHKNVFLHGYGIGNYTIFSEDFSRNPKTDRGLEAHNDYLRLLIEIGVIGLLIYVWILFRIWRLCLILYGRIDDMQLKSFMVIFLSLFVAFLVVSLSSNLVVTPVFQWYFWCLVSLICSIQMKREVCMSEV